MVSVSLTLLTMSHEAPPVCAGKVYRIARTGERFIVLDLCHEVTVTLDGFDAKAVTTARAVAVALLEAADQLERERAGKVYRIARTDERFIVLDLCHEVTVTLDGFDAKAVTTARAVAVALLEAADQLERERDAELCDCIASGNPDKPKQHGADPHAKNCRVYVDKRAADPPPAPCPDLPAAESVPDLIDSVF